MFLLRAITKERVKLSCFARPYLRKYSGACVRSEYQDIEVPEQTITQCIWSESSKWEDLPAMTCGVSGRSYTYGLAKFLYKRAAVALSERVKLKKGDRIGLLLPNIPEFMIAVHASVAAGLVITFANPLHTVEELQRQFVDAGVKCIVTIPLLLETALVISKNLSDYTYTINVGGDTDARNKVLGMESLLSESHDADADLPRVKSTDVAVLPYSSGTTGLPKGVMLTHRNLVANIIQCSHPDITKLTVTSDVCQETVFTVLPFFHIMGFNAIMNVVMHQGSHLVTMPRFNPADYLSCLEKHRPTTLFVVPPLMLFLTTHPEVTATHLSSIRRVVCGAAPASKTLIANFLRKLDRDDCIVDQGYGMTETSPVALYTPKSTPASKLGSCGKLVSSTLARVIDPTDGRNITAPNAVGEILLKGPQIMKGYLNNPKATAETIDPEGWLHTGDVGYYDEDGYFFVIDRTKELIKVKGNQVSPTELESLILQIPGVSDVAVIGVPDEVAGELPKAFVVKKPNVDLDAQTIRDYVTRKVAPYKRLEGGVSFIDAIPRNVAGKTLRQELKKL